MNILVTLDANYIRPLSVMLHSLVRADDCPKFDLYIAHSSLTDENIDSIFRGIDRSRWSPCIVISVLRIPGSRFLVGTGSGVTGSFVALVAGTVPFFARQIESVPSDIDHGLIEASQAMGFSPREIIFSVYLKESIPGITRVTMITFVSLVGITAIAGAIGAGGLGDFAIRYGYQMGYRDMIWLTVIIILAIISVFQFFGNLIVRRSTH